MAAGVGGRVGGVGALEWVNQRGVQSGAEIGSALSATYGAVLNDRALPDPINVR